MNFTSSPYERMMKEVPRPGGSPDRCAGCRYFKECRSKKSERCKIGVEQWKYGTGWTKRHIKLCHRISQR